MLRRDGQLVVYRDRQQLENDAAVWVLRRRQGQMRIVERPEMPSSSRIGPAYTMEFFLPDEAMVANPYRYCQALAAALAERGTRSFGSPWLRFEFADGAVSGVRGASAVHRADAVIVCAGAWSMQLLGPLGYRIPLETQRGYHITLRDTGIDIRRPVVPADRKVFITSQEAGLRVGGTVELAGLEAPPNPRRAELLLRDLRAVFPQARTEGPRSNWMGHRPCLPDSLPVIGEGGRHRGLWLAFGHGHLGLTAAAVTGEALARSLFGETPRLDLRPFSVARFSGPAAAAR